MPTITIVETFGSREAQADDKGQRTRNRQWHISTDDATLGVDEVTIAVPVQRGDIWVSPYGATDPGCTCRKLSIKERESPYEWDAVAEFSSEPLASSGAQGSGGGGSPSQMPDQTQQENPLARPVEIRFGSVKERVPCLFDSQETPIQNSAGDPFDPPYEIEVVREVVTLTWNAPMWEAGIIAANVNHVNSTEWHGILPGHGKCTELTAERHFENGVIYWRVTMTVEIYHVEDEEWKVKLLDAGFRENGLDADLNIISVPIVDLKFGRPVTKPALLDGAGVALERGSDPVFLTFFPWDSAEFNALI